MIFLVRLGKGAIIDRIDMDRPLFQRVFVCTCVGGIGIKKREYSEQLRVNNEIKIGGKDCVFLKKRDVVALVGIANQL